MIAWVSPLHLHTQASNGSPKIGFSHGEESGGCKISKHALGFEFSLGPNHRQTPPTPPTSMDVLLEAAVARGGRQSSQPLANHQRYAQPAPDVIPAKWEAELVRWVEMLGGVKEVIQHLLDLLRSLRRPFSLLHSHINSQSMHRGGTWARCIQHFLSCRFTVAVVCSTHRCHGLLPHSSAL